MTRLGVVMTPEPGNPHEADGGAQPRERPRAGRPSVPAPAARRGRQRLAGRPGRGRAARRRPRRGPAPRCGPRPRRGLGARRQQRRRRGPAHHLGAEPRAAPDDVRRLRPARAAAGARRLRGPRALAAPGPGAVRLPTRSRHRPVHVPQQGRGVLPRGGARSRRQAVVRDAAPADVGPRLVPRGRDRAPARRHHGRTTRDLDLVRPGRARRGRHPRPRATREPPLRRAVRVRRTRS